jgi:hypothetical protein
MEIGYMQIVITSLFIIIIIIIIIIEASYHFCDFDVPLEYKKERKSAALHCMHCALVG